MQLKSYKGLRRDGVTLSGLRDVNFSGRDGRECQRRIPLFWCPVVLG